MKKLKIIAIAAAALVILMAGTGTAVFAVSEGSPPERGAAAPSDDNHAARPNEGPEGKAFPSDSGPDARETDKGPWHGKDGVHVNIIKIAASVLGQSENEVKEKLRTGKVGDLLVAAGKVDEFKAAYLAGLSSKLDEAVAAGTLTQEQADEKYASGKEKMDAYDGSADLCGGSDHSKMFEKRNKPHTGGGSGSANSDQ